MQKQDKGLKRGQPPAPGKKRPSITLIIVLFIGISLIFASVFYIMKRNLINNGTTALGRPMIEKNTLFGGKLPPAEREQFKNDIDKPHSCLIDPDRLELEAGGAADLRIILITPDPDYSYRVVLGDLPNGVSGNLVDGNGQASIKLRVGDDPQIGSFSLSVIYQIMEKAGFFEQGKLKTAICQYNLVINR